MKWKNRLTNYNFWISIVSAILLILQAFKFEFDIIYINEIATAVLGLLVVIGIISDPTKISVNSKESVEKSQNLPTKEEIQDLTASVQNDFKTVVNQISNDINSAMAEIGLIQSSVMNIIDKQDKVQQEEISEEVLDKLIPQTQDEVEVLNEPFIEEGQEKTSLVSQNFNIVN